MRNSKNFIPPACPEDLRRQPNRQKLNFTGVELCKY